MAKGRVYPLVRVAQQEQHDDDGAGVAQDDGAWKGTGDGDGVASLSRSRSRKRDMGHLGAVGKLGRWEWVRIVCTHRSCGR